MSYDDKANADAEPIGWMPYLVLVGIALAVFYLLDYARKQTGAAPSASRNIELRHIYRTGFGHELITSKVGKVDSVYIPSHVRDDVPLISRHRISKDWRRRQDGDYIIGDVKLGIFASRGFISCDLHYKFEPGSEEFTITQLKILSEDSVPEGILE